ncbi:glycoside hydrolase family 88 protein [Sinomicrobium sp. M5D2P9]
MTKTVYTMVQRLPIAVICISLLFFTGSCSFKRADDLGWEPDRQLGYCEEQAVKTLERIPGADKLPRNIPPGTDEWRFVEYEDWTSGFWPGILWYLYEYTGEEKWKREADGFSRYLEPLSRRPATDHDLGFQVFNSFGNGCRLTNNPEYKEIILRTADTLATLYNPTVGTILSWSREVPNMEWPQHNTIIDNMINLELLFWASKNGGGAELYDMAEQHARTTMQNHFREDFSVYHAVVYDTLTGEKIKAVTHQGYADESMWARGQAWAIYGYTMVYGETGKTEFLDFAHKVAKVYLDRLPDDLIPYWDFDAPGIPDEPRDASAAAIVASALIELSGYTDKEELSREYLNKAEAMLKVLSGRKYRSGNGNSAFLLHSTGHKPNGSEVDYSIIYADYYYIEALVRLKKLREEKSEW